MKESPFVTVSGWSSHKKQLPEPRSDYGHNRSLSSLVRSTTPKPTHTSRSPSTSELPVMETDDAVQLDETTTPHLQCLLSRLPEQHDLDRDMSTLPDPRSRAMTPVSDELVNRRHPDLNEEVATLSTKLIIAINHQTILDDSLSATRLELDKSHGKIRKLEVQLAEQREMLAGDVWVRRKTIEHEKSKLLTRVAEERRARHEVEQQKKKIERELENLTAALFEEANKMVISAKEEARKEHEALQRKNDVLKAQLVDEEGLLKSQQEQLAELKGVMEQMSSEKEDQPAATVPSSPGCSKWDRDQENGPDSRHQSIYVEPLTPSSPARLAPVLHPVIRTDTAAFADFQDLVRTTRRLSARTFSALAGGGVAGSVGASLTNASSTFLTSHASSTTSCPQTPGSPGSVGLAAPLRDTKFYKRALVEDIEPTLRLDSAPGISWLARRNVLCAMTEGSMVIEPNHAPAEPWPCAMCGESRTDEEHLRTHCFRTNESASASRYGLCKYCHSRVRSTCDFLGFLRIVKDGHWRAADEDAEKAAYEESVRLREQMFWARIGGGVSPASPAPLPQSGANSVCGTISPRTRLDMPAEMVAGKKSGDATASDDKAGNEAQDDAAPDQKTVPPSDGTYELTEKPFSLMDEAIFLAIPGALENS